jgi:ABC-type sugar transport system permease subunit
MGALMMFAEVYVMTTGEGGAGWAGGPAYSTITIMLYIFNTAFSYFHYGYASAIAVVTFIILVTIGFIQFRLLRTTFEY